MSTTRFEAYGATRRTGARRAMPLHVEHIQNFGIILLSPRS
jgi:hypothetical protein